VSSFRVILVAVDKSEHSDKAVAVARDLAKVSGGVVHVFHVLERQVVVGKSGGAFELETEEEAESLLSSEIAVLTEAGVKVQPQVRRGRQEETFHTILQVADEVSADVIVMGTRGLSTLAALVLGSTTYKVLHVSKRPVLVVP
jgi:nucleotide-binding universal stress UspA family protein